MLFLKEEYFEEQLLKIKKKFPLVIEGIRGKGLLKGIKLKVENTKFINQLFEHKLLVVKASENVVRLLPPLIVKVKMRSMKQFQLSTKFARISNEAFS